MDGTKLVAVRKSLCWTQERAAEEFAVGLTTIHRWEKGEVVPRGESLLLIREKYGLTPTDLGIIEEPGGSKESKSDTISLLASEHLQHLSTLASHDLFTHLWPLAFQPYSGYQPLQDAMNLALKEYDTMHTNNPNHHIKRREALQRLVTLPLAPALLSFNALSSLEQQVERNTLAQYALGIAACRELSKSAEHDDLVTALHGVSAYVQPLQIIVKDFAHYRHEAAGLVAQALLLKTVLTWHLKNPYQALLVSDEAITYANESRDTTLIITALTGRTWICYYNRQYQEGLLSSERAIAQLRHAHVPVPAVVQSRAYSTYAVIQTKQGQIMSSSLHNAADVLTRSSEKPPAYVEYTLANLALNTAIAKIHSRQYQGALKSLNDLVDVETLEGKHMLPARTAIEVLNHAALAELKNPRRDKEMAIHLWKAGALRTRALQSEQRFNEVVTNYGIMEALWPDDAEINDLYDLTVHW